MKLSSGTVVILLGNASFGDVSAFPSSFPCPAFGCTEWSQSSLYLALQDESRSENHRRTIKELSDDEFILPDVISKMDDIALALTSFVEEKVEEDLQPRPPGTPPPLHMLQSSDSLSGSSQENMFFKTQVAPEGVQERLGKEVHGGDRADEMLLRPLLGDEVLKRAEEVIQKSRASAEKRKLEAVKAAVQAEEVSEATMTRHHGLGQPEEGTHNLSESGPRSTIPLVALSGSSGRAATIREGTSLSGALSLATRNVPILSNWIHCSDGSIRGQVYNSDIFPDGTEISTSTVCGAVLGGTTIETSSGSCYFLDLAIENEDLTEHSTSESHNAESHGTASPVAPHGIPTIIGWKMLDSGGIAGLLYGSAGANDGDYVETSPIANGVLTCGQVVVTASGSQYFLSPAEDDRISNIVAAFQDMSKAVHGSTITLTKELARRNLRTTEGSADGTSRQPRRRSTFSLFDLMGKKRQRRTGGATGPDGLPMLTQWRVNPDKTITGTVSGSPHLSDGDVITTSEILKGIPEQFGKVTTASGSIYFLA